jgi:proline iminopeptidase
VVGAAVVPLTYVGLVRPRLARLGATADEARRTLPGDDLVAGARGRTTMATTIDAPPAEVWPWLAQMGHGRAGWYSVDRLDLFGDSSAEELHPEWQAIAVGDRRDSAPNGRTWFDVALVEPEHALGLTARIDLRRGTSVPVGERLPRIASESSWVFVLDPVDGATRLLVRTAGRQRPRPLALVNPFGWLPVHVLMQRRQLRGLRERVERGPGTEPERAINAPLAVAA